MEKLGHNMTVILRSAAIGYVSENPGVTISKVFVSLQIGTFCDQEEFEALVDQLILENKIVEDDAGQLVFVGHPAVMPSVDSENE